MSVTKLGFALKVGVTFWLLLAPGENWTWVIVGGHDVQHACEEARNERLDGDYLVCAATPPSTAVQPTTINRPALAPAKEARVLASPWGMTVGQTSEREGPRLIG